MFVKCQTYMFDASHEIHRMVGTILIFAVFERWLMYRFNKLDEGFKFNNNTNNNNNNNRIYNVRKCHNRGAGCR
jgi:hypothetical protein